VVLMINYKLIKVKTLMTNIAQPKLCWICLKVVIENISLMLLLFHLQIIRGMPFVHSQYYGLNHISFV